MKTTTFTCLLCRILFHDCFTIKHDPENNRVLYVLPACPVCTSKDAVFIDPP